MCTLLLILFFQFFFFLEQRLPKLLPDLGIKIGRLGNEEDFSALVCVVYYVCICTCMVCMCECVGNLCVCVRACVHCMCECVLVRVCIYGCV